MSAGALIAIVSTGAGLAACGIGVWSALRKRRARSLAAPLVPGAALPATSFLPSQPAPGSLPPRDHFALSYGNGVVRTLPSGTVTLLFTDVVGSTRLWQEQPILMGEALARHDVLLHAVFPQYRGHVFKTVGDGFYAVFATASDGAAAALATQQAVRAHPWPPGVSLQIRVGLHSGPAEQRDGDYFGPVLNRLARMIAAAHGGQVLISDATRSLIQEYLPADASLRGLGLVRLRDLAQPEPIYQLVHPDLDDNFPPLRSLDTLPNNLPQPTTSFIGREQESEAVKDLLTRTRLLTLLGTGGAGKSRLSVQVAADLLDQYPDGVWQAELAPLSEGSLVVREVARILHVPEDGDMSVAQSLAAELERKHLLLLLDNCEHVLAECAELAALLLRQCPQVHILATSRQALGAAGEQVYPIPSLGLPQAGAVTAENVTQSECARLFIDRAMLQEPQFQVTPGNAPAIAQICARLDGIPLAIELGAARVGALTVEEINSRLDNRFRLLTRGSRTALPRQQTLQALIDWSYNLLNDDERRLLRRLSVFSGGWTLEAAEDICASEQDTNDVLDTLAELVGKSLVVAESVGGHTRYRLLETVRQYSRDKLTETNEAQALIECHRCFFLALAEEADRHLFGPAQGQWLDTLQADHDNLRTAQDACIADSGCGQDALSLATALRPFWMRRGACREGLERARAALAHTENDEDTPLRADVFRAASILARQLGNYGEAESFQNKGLAVCRKLSDQKRQATALSTLGNIAQVMGQFGRARDLYAEGLALAREVGDPGSTAYAQVALGLAHYRLQDYGNARALQEDGLAAMRSLEDADGMAYALGNLTSVALAQRDYARVGAAGRECLVLYQGMGNLAGVASTLDSLAELALAENDPRRAVRLLGACASLYQTLGIPQTPSDQAQFDSMRTRAQTLLSPDDFAFCWEQGRAMSVSDVVSYALETDDDD